MPLILGSSQRQQWTFPSLELRRFISPGALKKHGKYKSSVARAGAVQGVAGERRQVPERGAQTAAKVNRPAAFREPFSPADRPDLGRGGRGFRMGSAVIELVAAAAESGVK
jgi:hypothetical protein